MNQLRRDPVTGIWTIVIQDGVTVADLKPDVQAVRTVAGESCSYCQGQEHETPGEIFAVRSPGSNRNEPGWRVRVVPEKMPVLQIHGDLNNRGLGLYDMFDGIGAHEVIIETPEHNRRLVDLPESAVTEVLNTYKDRILDLKKDVRFRYVLLHKSLRSGNDPHFRHAHSNILATPITPQRVREEFTNAQQFFNLKERCLFCDIIRQELEDSQRLVAENGDFIALCPFAGRAPFETWILPRRHETFFEGQDRMPGLAKMLLAVLGQMRTLLGDPNYVMEIHSGPNVNAGKQRGYWKTVERDFHWHLEITPRLRSYTSFEMGFGFPVNPMPPEKAAELMRLTVAA
ncbi:MAG: galactose-1-phosphate uridylyltransferase [candidate division KSB1 bacterium]|nr:galactose-1-phosphate uridylyltransferase [candidate division KSB1 bacterium]MDZ7272881.1 galactose-1-phosphate uridylyltransferase [candidate division KSB1 bacterium]MDZ7284096.1 galactose-1-phosphate uridylyltransferase [candidate division KSB1 bacterium]MDZ7297506.1 galactose-1-phosphate uridylyltransferase [candidate division KSB1 bacterium]MDZ7305642.1 galactose-1-phosphate uridylyltransferase [candidate division KSB1 bacterium]